MSASSSSSSSSSSNPPSVSSSSSSSSSSSTLPPVSSSSSSSSSSGPEGPGPFPWPTPPNETCGNNGGDTSTWPVRYFNGELQLAVTDLSSSGFGTPWQQRRQYSNQLGGKTDMGLGYNWIVESWPYLLKAEDGDITFVRSSRDALWFNSESGGYVAKYGAKSTLTHDVGTDIFTLSMPSGQILKFHGFGGNGSSSSSSGGSKPLAGTLDRIIDAGGNVTEVVGHTASGSIQTLQRQATIDGTLTTDQFHYAFDGNSRTTSVTYRRQVDSNGWSDIRRVTYEYYGDDNSSSSSSSSGAASMHGSPGDLKRVRIQEPDGTLWKNIQQTYYRYYTPGASKGFVHGLKYVLEPDGYDRMLADSLDPLAVSDAVLMQYAKYAFEYDGDHRVAKETVDQASLTASFAYETSDHADDYNKWHRKTTETRPDGSIQTVFTNYIGQVMLSQLTSGSDSWINYRSYDSEGRVVQVASPSAVSGYNEAAADLGVSLKANEGLIRNSVYYASPDPAAGYLKSESIQQGSSGTPVLQSQMEYVKRTVGDQTIFPLLKQTRYRNDDGTGAIETTMAYEWHSGTVQVKQQTTTLPVVPTSQNGSGVAATTKAVFDQYGNPTWTMDARGFITHNRYDIPTGAVVQRIDDVDTSQASDVPLGWATPSGGGLNLVHDFEIDARGRVTQELGPAHTIDLDGTASIVRTANWTVYKDQDYATWTAQGYATGSAPNYAYTLFNPVNLQYRNARGNQISQIQATRASTNGRLEPTDTFSQSSYTALTTWEYTDCCLASKMRVYHTIPASGSGSVGTNYNETVYGYDSLKRRNREVSPGGTITRTTFDVRSRPTGTYIGTNDTGATASDPTAGTNNNMVQVTGMTYDHGNDGGDGNLTRQTQYVDSITTRVTDFSYDWRNRRVTTDGELDFFQKVTYDNLNQATKTERFDTTASGNLVARQETKFDDAGRTFQTIQWGVDPATGTVGNALTSNTWFDDAGNTVKSQPAGSKAWTKQAYDGLGRVTTTYSGFGTDNRYSDVLNVTGDIILSQSETVYDAGGTAIQQTGRERYHNAPASQTGALGTPSIAPNARVSYAASYADGIGRSIAEVGYGTNGGTALSRSATIPTGTDSVLVTTMVYDSAGRLKDTIDPAGRTSQTLYDAAGRTIETIANVAAVSPPSSSSSGNNCADSADKNQTVRYTYTPDGDQNTLTAVNSVTGDQVTTYEYGTTLSDSGIASSRLLRRELYPDSTGPTDSVTFSYNRQFQRTSLTDQNGTVRQFDFDALGRQTQDRVTTLGTGVDGSVRRIEQAYTVRGEQQRISSFDNATIGSGAIVNEITRTFDDFGNVVKTHQSHNGAVNTSTTPWVGQTHTDGSSDLMRQTKLTYPDGREITYGYGANASIPDNTNQVSSLTDHDSIVLASYEYVGQSTVVQQDSTQADLRYTLIDLSLSNDPDTGDIYSGLDRFGRVKDVRWRDVSAASDFSRIEYSYDRVGNRIWRENPSDPNREHDWLYRYNGLNRLQSADRGQLNTARSVISTLDLAQCWTLDPVGNWDAFRQDDNGDGTWDFVQDRTSNKVNEITDIDNTVGDTWVTPAYDKNGNSTTLPRPDLATGGSMTATYDAWNRMVKLVDVATSNTLLENEYDGRNFRVVAKEYASGTLDQTRHYYFTDTWQCVEERIDSQTVPERQHVWGIRYIDDLVVRDRATTSGGALNERHYYLADANWNTTAVVSTSGTVDERYEYDPYGKLSYFATDYTPRTDSNYETRYTYTSREWTPEASLYYFRNRWYDDRLGRFVSRDPIGYDNGLNLVSNEFVLNRLDPLGTKFLTDTMYADVFYFERRGALATTTKIRPKLIGDLFFIKRQIWGQYCPCYCVQVSPKSSQEYLVTAEVRLMTQDVRRFYATERGYSDVIAHEMRRVQAVKDAHDEYLLGAKNNLGACGEICRLTAWEARDALKEWLTDLHTRAIMEYEFHVTLQWLGIKQLPGNLSV